MYKFHRKEGDKMKIKFHKIMRFDGELITASFIASNGKRYETHNDSEPLYVFCKENKEQFIQDWD